MADMSFLRSDLHRESGRNRTYYRGANGGRPFVNGGQPLQPLTHRSVRDALVDGNRVQDKLMAKLMAAYEDIEAGSRHRALFRDPKPKKKRPLKLPGVVRARNTPSPATRTRPARTHHSQEAGRSSTSEHNNSRHGGSESRQQPASSTAAVSRQRRKPATAPAGPRTVAAPPSSTSSSRGPLWAPKRNNLLEKQKETRAATRKLRVKPKRTPADKALSRLEKEADGLRVCLNKIGPKGRGITLITTLTAGSRLTCVGCDNTRGLKYRLVLTADENIAEQTFSEKMHVLHALAVAVRISEIPRKERSGGSKGAKDGWGNDLRLDVDPDIMVEQMSKQPRNLNPEAELQAMEEEEEELKKQRAREANRALRERRAKEAERIRKIDEAIRQGKKPALKGEESDEDEFEDESDEDSEEDYDEGSDQANAFNKQFNQKPKVQESPSPTKKEALAQTSSEKGYWPTPANRRVRRAPRGAPLETC
eukprot:INCI4651.1.p1 GENE.INCI4651.1~~INCI4651.1.p1  ORF type:complete len:478 (+),score=70.60 INCI4651.1:158-1591(+)